MSEEEIVMDLHRKNNLINTLQSRVAELKAELKTAKELIGSIDYQSQCPWCNANQKLIEAYESEVEA